MEKKLKGLWLKKRVENFPRYVNDLLNHSYVIEIKGLIEDERTTKQLHKFTL